MECIQAQKSSVGKVRTKNEDAYGFSKENLFYFVCDGMGGHVGGDFASQTIVESVTELVEAEYPEKQEYIDALISLNPTLPADITDQASAILLANRRIFNVALQYPYLRGMGTTIAALYIKVNTVYTLHAGDSRVYRIRDKSITQLTKDHSWVNELLEDKEITPEEAKQFKKKNVVTRVLGTQQYAKIECNVFRAAVNDLYLLCSDGLTTHLSDKQIRDTVMVNSKNLEAAVRNLLKSANNAGGTDNITAMLVKIVRSSDTPDPVFESEKSFEITDNQDGLFKLEDRILKNRFPHKPAGLPEEPQIQKKTFKNQLPFISVIAVLSAVLAASVFIVYKNINNKQFNPGTYTLVSSNEYDPNILTGRLEVVTDPSGAEVYIAGSSTPSGLSPIMISLNDLDPEGTNIFDVRIKKYGYMDVKLTKEIIINDTITLTLSLTPETLIEVYLGIEADFPESAHVYIAPADNSAEAKEISTIGRLKNIAYQGGLPHGEYTLMIINNDSNLWSYSFKAYTNRKAKIYIGNEKGIESIYYEDF